MIGTEQENEAWWASIERKMYAVYENMISRSEE
jgi:hypothetical protein